MKLLLSMLIFISTDMLTTATLDSNDQMYVWARNGLNVRSGPGTSYDIIDKLSFGDSVEVILDTDIRYNIGALTVVDTNYFSYKTEKIQPYIMHGWWRKIITDNGTIGYTISQYLIGLKPAPTDDDHRVALPLQQVDTIHNEPIYSDGEGLNSIVKYMYPNNIIRTDENGGVWGSSSIEFPGLTFTEVLIIMEKEVNNLRVRRNWKEELYLVDNDEICKIKLTQKENKVIYTISCSC